MAAKKKTVPYWRRLQLRRQAELTRKKAKAKPKKRKPQRRLVAVIYVYEYR